MKEYAIELRADVVNVIYDEHVELSRFSILVSSVLCMLKESLELQNYGFIIETYGHNISVFIPLVWYHKGCPDCNYITPAVPKRFSLRHPSYLKMIVKTQAW